MVRRPIGASVLKTAQTTPADIHHNSNDVKEEGAVSRINQEEMLTKAVLLGRGTSASAANQREFAPLPREGGDSTAHCFACAKIRAWLNHGYRSRAGDTGRFRNDKNMI